MVYASIIVSGIYSRFCKYFGAASSFKDSRLVPEGSLQEKRKHGLHFTSFSSAFYKNGFIEDKYSSIEYSDDQKLLIRFSFVKVD